MDKLVYWIWLSLACTPGSSTFSSLLQRFSDAKEIYNAEDSDFRGVIDRKLSDRTALLDKNLDEAKRILAFCKSNN